MASPLQRRAIYAAVVTAVFFCAAELAARQVNPILPEWGAADNPTVVMTGHPTRLWGLAPGERKNVDAVATVNALGLRGDMLELPRPEGEERIAVVGDSSFFGFGLADEDTLAARLAVRMRDVTTINAGIPGYSTEQSLRLLDDVVWDLEPTLLVLASFWSDTNYEPYRDKDLLQSVDLRQNTLLSGSSLVRWLAPWVSRLRPADRGHVVTWVRGSELPAAEHRRVGLTDYAANLDQIVREAAQRGIGVILLTPPSPVEIEAKVSPPHQWEPYRAAQEAVAKHHGLPHLDMTPAFAAAYRFDDSPDISKFFLDDLHPTALGQTLMAQLVERVLRQRGWPESRLTGRAGVAFDAADLRDTTPKSRAGRPADDSSPIANLFVAGQSPGRQAPGGHTEALPSSLRAEISGGVGPYRLTAEQAGRALASAMVQKPRSVQLKLPGAAGTVTVTCTDAEGSEVTAKAVFRDGGEQSVRLVFSP